MNNTAPIIVFVYNRPDHAERTINALLNNPEAKDSVLYIFSDGPKVGAKEEVRKRIQEVKKYIHTIEGFKQVIIKDYHENQGLATIIMNGVTEVFKCHDRAIMVEDDCVASPYFLSYENRCLEKYKDDERIWAVCGYVDNSIVPKREGDDLFLVNRPSSWGYGTWKRCWDKVIWDIDELKKIFSSDKLVMAFNRWGGMDFSRMMFGTFKNHNSSWAIRFDFGAFQNKAFTILPNKTMIHCIGMDGSGDHGANIKSKAHAKIEMMDHDVIIPDDIKFDAYRNDCLTKGTPWTVIKARLVPILYRHPRVKKIVFKITGKGHF